MKSRLQFDIDRMIKQSKSWKEFLKKMVELGYEIKYGKHIAFKHKDKERFTRAKTIGEDYIEDRLKERIVENATQRIYTVKSVLEISLILQIMKRLRQAKVMNTGLRNTI